MNPIEVSNNCKLLKFKISVAGIVSDGENIVLRITNNTNSVDVSAVVSGGYIITGATFETAGIVTYEVIYLSEVVKIGYTVSSCEIDCCIAKLTESAINCTCKCDKCKEELDRAEKILLLLISAKHAAEVEQNKEDAIAKYNKAKEFCTEVCACGC